jgi:hypothetical protein
MSPSERSRSRLPGCLLTLLLLLLFVLAVLHFTAPVIATSAANKALPEQLNTGAKLEKVRLNLLTGAFGIDGLVIAQPAGFDGDPLLRLGSLDLSLPVGRAIRRDPVLVRDIHLDGLDFRLVTDTNAVANVTRLGPADPPPEAEEDDAPAAPPPVWIQKVLLENITFVLEDLAKEWNLRVEDIRVEVEDLRIAHDSPGGPARVSLDLSLPGEKATGRLLIRGKVGAIHPGRADQAPPAQLAMGLVGFDLDLIDPFLVKGARTAIGGTGFDYVSFLQIHPGATLADQTLSGRFRLATDGGHVIEGEPGGTMAKPRLPITGLISDLLGNQFGRVAKLGGNLAQGGVEAGKTVLKTGGEAVKGAGKTVAKFGGGLLKTAKGVVTLDVDEAKKGLSDATIGTVGEAAGTVGKTVGTAAKGVGDTANTAMGGDDRDRWWALVDQRAAAFEREAEAWFSENPFPPGTPAAETPEMAEDDGTMATAESETAPGPEPAATAVPTAAPEPTATPRPAPTPEPEPAGEGVDEEAAPVTEPPGEEAVPPEN